MRLKDKYTCVYYNDILPSIADTNMATPLKLSHPQWKHTSQSLSFGLEKQKQSSLLTVPPGQHRQLLHKTSPLDWKRWSQATHNMEHTK